MILTLFIYISGGKVSVIKDQLRICRAKLGDSMYDVRGLRHILMQLYSSANVISSVSLGKAVAPDVYKLFEFFYFQIHDKFGGKVSVIKDQLRICRAKLGDSMYNVRGLRHILMQLYSSANVISSVSLGKAVAPDVYKLFFYFQIHDKFGGKVSVIKDLRICRAKLGDSMYGVRLF
ncbi:uncharacterized protein LOC117186881 isoform X2 [Drosophila miranda]|uniref:uncharacterized protein LOC117186881 isoform X2 n=1 Tax=Drosophila miranda TaxID=7229 RepID=UPI00143F1795|nr:uncharacterized protein LOC117186881 isoform X2 [Drosophila miranda]